MMNPVDVILSAGLRVTMYFADETGGENDGRRYFE